MSERRLTAVLAIALVTLAVTLRLLPHPANFAPVTAIAIFGGAVLPRKLALGVPLAAMVTSDAIIGFYSTMPITWTCYLLIALASSLWLQKPTLVKGATLTLSSSFFFFLVTNFAVWLWSGMYASTWPGLVQCYTLALPFFRSSIISDASFTTALFAILALARFATSKLLKPAQQEI